MNRKLVIILNIPIEVKRKCLEMSNSGVDTRKIYTDYFSKHSEDTYTGFRGMLSKWKKKAIEDQKYLDGGSLGFTYTPTRTTVQVNAQGEVVQAWIKSHTNDSIWLQIIDTIKNLQPFEPIKKREVRPKDRMLEIPFDDMHWGVAFLEDYEDTLQDTIEYIEAHQYKEIIIVIGEDLLHTDDLKGHTSNGTYIGEVDVARAYNDCLKFYFAIMDKSLEHSERVRVTYSMGNHSETLSWTIVQMLKQKYPQAEYDDSFEVRKVITYGQVFIGLTHGDCIPSSLPRVKELFVDENALAYANAKIREIHIGHYHMEKEAGDINGCVVRRLSTKVPTDKWHKKKGYTGAVKRFMLFEYTSDSLKDIHYV